MQFYIAIYSVLKYIVFANDEDPGEHPAQAESSHQGASRRHPLMRSAESKAGRGTAHTRQPVEPSTEHHKAGGTDGIKVL